MKLARQKPGVIGNFDHFNQVPVPVDTGNNQAVIRQHITVDVIELVAVTVALGYIILIVGGVSERSLHDGTGERPETHGAPFFTYRFLLLHQVDERFPSFSTELT